MAKIVILLGSPSERSRLHGVLDRVLSIASASGVETSVISVRDLPAEDLLYARFDSEAIKSANRVVEEADAVIVATPVYKASFPGVLKAYIDLLPQKGLENKIVLPIAIGGTIAHLLSIDFAMKPVLSTMGPRNILAGVFVLDSQVKWNEDGTADISEDIAGRLDESVRLLLQEVAWQTNKAKA
ncbi:FMN reductase (NADPH) [Cohnella xylanilytica]|uniref:NADPH-dependent FMN reductase n=1 Tax=Cohnella xylanilytica TaxID=557555 RepID=A0A841U1S4_9BACL|nr:NADPH-dependent FMN reductase [Cohnella xylanilytica]MBB6694707.1 NADPH-dependent FMN reductase [Cohnella xylanilytica]GIO13951.1 FMN reductase (NADPH) [Cohnella xylanilytica]